ncbi:MAG TPA: hypothetical protein VGI64_07460 [Streptosporangiaceae bacterium]
MTNPRDEIDAWLDREIEPLPPPPGTYQRITRSAQRRKTRQATMSAGAAVILVAAAVAVPRVVGTVLRSHSQVAAAGPSRAGSVVPGTSGSPGSPSTGTSPRSQPATSTTTQPSEPAESAPPTGIPVASHFQPTSITMVGQNDGVALGTALCGPAVCTRAASTASYGTTWSGLAGVLPGGSSGVSQIRFLTTQVGWAYGPALDQTFDGGTTWSPVNTGGQTVIDLEAAGQRAFAVFGTCAGPADDAANCGSLSLHSAVAGSSSWQNVPVPSAARLLRPAGGSGAASLVLASGGPGQAGTGYLLTPTGAVLTGSLTGGAWRLAGQVPHGCAVGQPQASGTQPSGALLASGATATAPQLVLSCQSPPGSASSGQVKTIYTSATGASWTPAGHAPVPGVATALAGSADGLVVLASTAGIYYSTDSGASWKAATVTTPPPGGFSYVGMTTSSQGVAVPANPAAGEIFTTSDGGRSWSPQLVK